MYNISLFFSSDDESANDTMWASYSYTNVTNDAWWLYSNTT